MYINISFVERIIEVKINDKVCISAKINTDLFKDKKGTLTMNGYSSGIHPIKIKINEISIYKHSY